MEYSYAVCRLQSPKKGHLKTPVFCRAETFIAGLEWWADNGFKISALVRFPLRHLKDNMNSTWNNTARRTALPMPLTNKGDTRQSKKAFCQLSDFMIDDGSEQWKFQLLKKRKPNLEKIVCSFVLPLYHITYTEKQCKTLQAYGLEISQQVPQALSNKQARLFLALSHGWQRNRLFPVMSAGLGFEKPLSNPLDISNGKLEKLLRQRLLTKA